ncbi:uncharacterized protein STEHIDRAFT_125267 [Stereum hirsutum FP-91666 SS1]|uniref:uncharacterized protein n=1 Tax=Stereum hirsutum (strain FP-91666) TaxID=721885 RepID=UPI000444947B|nr:uncharacterized protein STEHIDRAFT_125267 [Stereum hirsutum FP-91666 SS1]EIM80939.1 hypothetical protein STEHIDRAFT_125267 [Stereum hirsutum FP-91666 SS1]
MDGRYLKQLRTDEWELCRCPFIWSFRSCPLAHEGTYVEINAHLSRFSASIASDLRRPHTVVVYRSSPPPHSSNHSHSRTHTCTHDRVRRRSLNLNHPDFFFATATTSSGTSTSNLHTIPVLNNSRNSRRQKFIRGRRRGVCIIGPRKGAARDGFPRETFLKASERVGGAHES